jgi:hypothetical protein
MREEVYIILRSKERVMKQVILTPAMGKRFIGLALVKHPDVQRVLAKGTLVIVAGSTNGYVAEEILRSLGQIGFDRTGFRRGVTVAHGSKTARAEFPGDVVITDGVWLKGKTIDGVADTLKPGDMIMKGANAFDPQGQPAVLIGNEKGGTILVSLTAVVGRRVQLLMPVGLEKRVSESVHELALRCNTVDSSGPRLLPVPGRIFTELDAITVLTGAQACLLAAGGIHGAEGAVYLGLSGDDSQVQAALDVVTRIQDEPATHV